MNQLPLFDGALMIDEKMHPNLFPIAETRGTSALEKHLIGLAKISYNTESPSQEEINSVATILEYDLGINH